MGFVSITFLDADRAVPIQTSVAEIRMDSEIMMLICQRLSKKYQEFQGHKT